MPTKTKRKRPTLLPSMSLPIKSPARILYKRMPEDMILIIGFTFFLSLKEIKSRYGDTVYKVYTSYKYHMFRDKLEDEDILVLTGHQMIIHKDELMTKKEFSFLVQTIKDNGKRLHDIVEQLAIGPIKIIHI